MKTKNIFLGFLFLVCPLSVTAQTQNSDLQYRRSSLYSIMINHTEQKFADEIREAFLEIPVPDRFNDHDLSVKVVDMDEKLKKAGSDKENAVISEFIVENQIASRMVARWFNRNKYTGACTMDLIHERGLYSATEFDKQLAARSSRGKGMLMDAGKELIGNTFLVVNDIRYIDKEKRAKTWGSILSVAGSLAAAYTGINAIQDATDLASTMINTIRGFSVKINTFLYRLEWDDAKTMDFYTTKYTSADSPEVDKKNNFDNARGSYTLRYVGKVESSGSTTSFMGIKEDQPSVMIRKACQRAIDENIVELQTAYEEFRSKTPLLTVEPLTAYIGMKEGVTENSKFEVLERIEIAEGQYEYKRVGVIKPVKNMIWDNRYMAIEESAPGATLGFTTFTKVSGKDFMRGMLIREISK